MNKFLPIYAYFAPYFRITEEDLKNGNVIPLRFVKFQNVSSITVSQILKFKNFQP